MNVKVIKMSEISVTAIKSANIRQEQFNNAEEMEKYKESIAALAHTIEIHGLLSPIIIRELTPEEAATVENGEKYGIIDGHTRFEAYKLLEKEEINCVIKNDEQQNDKIISATANFARADMLEIDKAVIIKEYYDTSKKSYQAVADDFGISKSYVSKLIRIKKAYDNPKTVKKEEPVIVDNILHTDKITNMEKVQKSLEALNDIDVTTAKSETLREHMKVLRSYRIELDKVITAINKLPDVRKAARQKESKKAKDKNAENNNVKVEDKKVEKKSKKVKDKNVEK